jgi:5'-nucleotidase
MMKYLPIVLGSLILFSWVCVSQASDQKNLRKLTILATNDIHGGVEAQLDKKGQATGGMALLKGAVQAIRTAAQAETDIPRGVLVVDGGDQFQGTLLSNYDEGQLVFSTMNEVGYDAAVPGNHDYDFGPIGWLDDRVTPTTVDKNPRGALERLVHQARFPLIDANVYYRDSLVDLAGHPVAVNGTGCNPNDPTALIDWTRARRPNFFLPYVIKTVADVRVALIGIDNQSTPTVTTLANVSDLCFRKEADEVLALRQELNGKADVFVLVMHSGDSDNEKSGSGLIQEILNARPGAIDAVVAGHTHHVDNVRVGAVPMIQSGANGKLFGRIDLTYDMDSHQVIADETQAQAGIRLVSESSFDGIDAPADQGVLDLIKSARQAIAPLSTRKLGTATAKLWTDRNGESPLSDLLTDALRELGGADVALINTGGIRDSLAAGEVTYENLFKVIPFGNRAVVLGDVSEDTLVKMVERSITTCGKFGALVPSGIRVLFYKDCSKAVDGIDPNAQLLHVETASGEVLYDRRDQIKPDPKKMLTIATLDFLADGGSGADGLQGKPVLKDLGIFREALADQFAAHPFTAGAKTDGRWKALKLQEQPSL